MERFITINLKIEGFHQWIECNIEKVSFLKYRHRHIFHVKIEKEVNHNNRDIEIILFKREVEDNLKSKFGLPCEFGNMSCEDICEYLINTFQASTVEVLEDGENGAKIRL